MKKQKRDPSGRIKDGIVQRLRSWWLARKLRKGVIPRGRRLSREEVHEAIQGSLKGVMAEVWGVLSVRVFRAETGTWEDLGVLSVKKITTAFRDYIVDSLQNSTTSPLSNFKYHGCGTGTAAEANTDTTLGTEVGSRATGTQIEGATANVYKTVATITPGNTYAITEHGVFSASTSGTLMDRSVFAAINVTAADSIEFTYEATFAAET